MFAGSKKIFAATLVAGLVGAGGSGAFALETKPVLTLDMAKAVADGCEQMAEQEGWRIIVAVVDSGANLVALRRMDGAFLGSIDVARMKAETSARFPFPTRMVEALAYGTEDQPPAVPGIAHVPGITAFAGGLPIMTEAGDHIGAVGVSGVTADQDEQCAQAGIDAIADQLR